MYVVHEKYYVQVRRTGHGRVRNPLLNIKKRRQKIPII